jgi:hypothetical protein
VVVASPHHDAASGSTVRTLAVRGPGVARRGREHRRAHPCAQHLRGEEKLREAPELEAKTLFEALLERRPDRYQEGHLRTLQRHVKQSATHHHRLSSTCSARDVATSLDNVHQGRRRAPAVRASLRLFPATTRGAVAAGP